MSVEKINDYSELNAHPYLIEFFNDSNLKDILEPLDKQATELEAVFHSLFSEVWIENGEGEQLDVIGIHLDIPRDGRDDTNYKKVLKVKAKINVSSGEPETIISIAKEIYGATSVEYVPDYPGKFIINHNGTLDFLLQSNAAFENNDNWELENGDLLEFQTEDLGTKNLIFSAIPAGVGITINKVP